MGERAGYIPSAIGGQKVNLAHTGFIFTPNAESMARWRGWQRIVRADQVGVFFCDAWRAFVAREDVVTAYNKSTLDLLVQAGVPPARGIALKGAYFNLGRATGSLDDVVLAEGLIPTPLELAGRAARRLGNAIALSEWLGRYPAEIYGLDA
jgi:hypothetical protein